MMHFFLGITSAERVALMCKQKKKRKEHKANQDNEKKMVMSNSLKRTKNLLFTNVFWYSGSRIAGATMQLSFDHPQKRFEIHIIGLGAAIIVHRI